MEQPSPEWTPPLEPDDSIADGAEDETGPVRTCIATGAKQDKSGLIRFVIGPDDMIDPDLDERLPGRGLWLTADRNAIAAALKRKSFNRAAGRIGRGPVAVPDDLAAVLEDGLRRRVQEGLGLARRAGQAVTGHEKVRARLDQGRVGVLLHAGDGGADGFRKLGPGARDVAAAGKLVDALAADELGAPFDKDRAVHVSVAPGKLAARILRDGRRLKGVRAGTESSAPMNFGPNEGRPITG